MTKEYSSEDRIFWRFSWFWSKLVPSYQDITLLAGISAHTIITGKSQHTNFESPDQKGQTDYK